MTQPSAGGAEQAFFVGEHNFNATVLCPATLGSVDVHRVLITVTFDLDALFIYPQVHQHIRHRLSAVTNECAEAIA